MAVAVTKDMWVSWKHDPVTQEFIARLSDKREMLKEGVVEGQASDERETQRVFGQCQALKDAILYATRDFEFIEEGENAD